MMPSKAIRRGLTLLVITAATASFYYMALFNQPSLFA